MSDLDELAAATSPRSTYRRSGRQIVSPWTWVVTAGLLGVAGLAAWFGLSGLKSRPTPVQAPPQSAASSPQQSQAASPAAAGPTSASDDPTYGGLALSAWIKLTDDRDYATRADAYAVLKHFPKNDSRVLAAARKGLNDHDFRPWFEAASSWKALTTDEGPIISRIRGCLTKAGSAKPGDDPFAIPWHEFSTMKYALPKAERIAGLRAMREAYVRTKDDAMTDVVDREIKVQESYDE